MAVTLAVTGCADAPSVGGENESGLPVGVLWSTAKGADGEPFLEVIGAVTLSDGSVVVGDHRTGLLHYFSGDGTPIATRGGTGSGPGEFRELTSIGTKDGTIVWAYDRVLSRVTYFDSEDGHVETLALTSSGISVASLVLGHLASGALVLLERTLPFPTGREESSYRDSTRLEILEPKTGSVHSIGTMPLFDVRLDANELGPLMWVRPLSPRLQAAVQGRGEGVVVGFSEERTLRLVGEDGTTRQVFEVPFAGRGVTDADVERVQALRRNARQPRRDFLQSEFPSTMPVFGRLLSGPEGDIWIEEVVEVGGRPRWARLSADGTQRSVVLLPPGFELLEVRPNQLLGVIREEDGSETVVRTVVGPTGGSTPFPILDN